MKIAFFGGEPLSMPVLEELKVTGIIPNLIICSPDALVGRKQILTPPPAKIWAEKNNIPILQPLTFKNVSEIKGLTDQAWDLFVVVAYNRILPKWILDIPKKGTLNVHPSLLPKFRGASPIRSAILNNVRETGVSIIQLDEKMDHGPIVAQMKTEISPDNWPIDGIKLDGALALQGGAMLAAIIPEYLAGKIVPTAQDHSQATFCTKITKDMSELKLDPYNLPTGAEAYQMLLKIRAFAGWPETFFIHENKRYKIKQAEIVANTLKIIKVIPEGKKEMDFANCFLSK